MKVRSGRWERAVLHGHVPEHPTPQAARTEYFSLTSKMCLPPGRGLTALLASGRRGGFQRRTVEQTVDAPLLLYLDSLAPLMLEQLVDVLQFVDALVPVAEQVIEVPKIILENIPVRTLVREPQLAEQLVEVPTILYFLKQNVDTPIPHGGCGVSGGLQGFLPGQSSSFTEEQTVDIPAPRSGARRLQGFLPEQSATAFGEEDYRIPAASVEQNVDIPVPVERLQDLRPGQSSASSSHSPAGFEDDALEGVFRTFSPG